MAPPVILIGFMGSGKSAVGKRLAAELGCRFVDADDEVERAMGISIVDAFSRHGEEYFRRHEEETVHHLIDAAESRGDGTVISLGGGAVTIGSVRRRLAGMPLVILLDQDAGTCFERSRGGGRPLARDREDFERLYRERERLYREAAGHVLDTRGKSAAAVAAAAAEIVRREGESA